MYCLSAFNRDLFKSYDCCFISAIWKILQMLRTIFLIPCLHVLEKNFLDNKYKKQMSYKENKSPFFWRHEKWPHFSLKSFIPSFSDSFLIEKSGKLERERRYVWKDLLNVDCQDSTCFAFLKLFKNEESFGKSFYFPFSTKCFDKNFKCFLFCTSLFLNAMTFEDSKRIKRYIFHYFV